MIESINQAGGGGNATDELAKVSSNDTTAGYLNGKLVAGTGISLTENNNGGNETLGIAIGNHDASLITTGTVATARLGTGTANSSTYLAGDQTYKAAVTSVNGSTGAVTVAGGDTTYTVTTADCENTALRVRMIDVTIPANTWADGERITIEVFREMSNQSGSTFASEAWIGGTGLVENAQNAQNISTGTNTNALHRFDFIRAGTSVYASRVYPTHFSPIYYNAGFSLQSGTSFGGLTLNTSVNFATNITLYIDHKWNSANATVYQRILWAKCYKSSAGQQ